MSPSGDTGNQSDNQAKIKPPEIIYKFKDEASSLENAPAQLIGNVLFNIQGLVNSVAKSTEGPVSNRGKRTRKTADLYSLNVRFKDGCISMEFFPAEIQTNFGRSGDKEVRQTPVFKKTAILLSTISDKNQNDAYIKLEIEKQIEDPGSRMMVFNALKGLLPPHDKEAEIGFKNIDGDIPQIKLHDVVFKGRVLRLLKKEMKSYEVEVSGAITRIRDDVPPSFVVMDYAGKLIKVQMPDDKRLQIVEYLAKRVPIRLTGVGDRKRGIADLDEIESHTKVTVDSVRDIKLKTPVECTLSYERSEDDSVIYWVVSNDELGIYGVDDTVDKAREMFETDLYVDYIAYKDLADDKLTKKAQTLKRELIRIFKGQE
ncbi:MAG: hypothetical protein ABR985_22225 [Methanotrichaceae archaeon]|jgi:hypothetical protein